MTNAVIRDGGEVVPQPPPGQNKTVVAKGTIMSRAHSAAASKKWGRAPRTSDTVANSQKANRPVDLVSITSKATNPRLIVSLYDNAPQLIEKARTGGFKEYDELIFHFGLLIGMAKCMYFNSDAPQIWHEVASSLAKGNYYRVLRKLYPVYDLWRE